MLEIFLGVLAALSFRDMVLVAIDYVKQRQRKKELRDLLDYLEDEEADDEDDCCDDEGKARKR